MASSNGCEACCGLCCLCGIGSWFSTSPWGVEGCCRRGLCFGLCPKCCGESFDEDEFDRKIKKDLAKNRDPNATPVTTMTTRANVNANANNTASLTSSSLPQPPRQSEDFLLAGTMTTPPRTRGDGHDRDDRESGFERASYYSRTAPSESYSRSHSHSQSHSYSNSYSNRRDQREESGNNDYDRYIREHERESYEDDQEQQQQLRREQPRRSKEMVVAAAGGGIYASRNSKVTAER